MFLDFFQKSVFLVWLILFQIFYWYRIFTKHNFSINFYEDNGENNVKIVNKHGMTFSGLNNWALKITSYITVNYFPEYIILILLDHFSKNIFRHHWIKKFASIDIFFETADTTSLCVPTRLYIIALSRLEESRIRVFGRHSRRYKCDMNAIRCVTFTLVRLRTRSFASRGYICA